MAEQAEKWSPAEVRKTIILISGVVIFITGIFLFLNQTKAQGVIDFKFGMLSGNIKSGSAGLFICFFGFILICVSMLPIKKSNNSSLKFDLIKIIKPIGLVLSFVLLLILIVVFIYSPNPSLLVVMVILAVPFSRVLDVK